MRVARVALFSLLFVIVLGGCQMRVEQRFEINENGSGTIKVVTLFDEEAQEFVTFGMGFEAIVQDAPAGFDTEVVEDGDMAGTAMSAGFSTLDEIPALTREISEEGGMGTVNVRKTGDAFIFQMTLPDDGLTVDGNDVGDLGDFGDFGDIEGFGELEDAIQFKVVAVLPGHIEDSNADEVDGDTAVWIISMLSPPTEMLYASSLPGSSQSSPIIWILTGVVGVGLVGLAIVSWRRTAKPSADTGSSEPSPEAPLEPAGAASDTAVAPPSDG